MKDTKGFLMIELIISLSLIGVIMLLVFNITIFNIKAFTKTEASVEIQQQAQFLKEFIEDKVYRSTRIDSIINLSGNRVNVNTFKSGEIREIRLYLVDGVVGIYIDKNSKKMFYRTDIRYNGYEIGNYINKMEIEKLQNGRGIKFNLEIQKKKETFDLEFIAYFRN
ncbi:PilW family protein [Alkalithermobacter paradoxus]|uniref:Prepilin-type N-terminal cleavage/methylation domain-containing protein n=1 Tax=Alkalithermobacter paradoxus TaxID=29349 RepID=A0A1V4I6X2_9FIRM|nr:hypothetical protein CLOTH_13790 [[Clostridium] thermoalcaliphilum]